MWHSQTKVWELMENAASSTNTKAPALGGGGNHFQQPSHYSRVAMLWLDVVYMTPIDIFKVPDDPSPYNFWNGKPDSEGSNPTWKRKGPVNNSDYYFFDIQNRHAVIPAFASYPVNDRMIYGPHAAVKIWATERWDRYHHHVLEILPTHAEESYGLHDERLIAYTVIPAIRTETRTEVMKDRNLYFLRVRANGNMWMGDSPYDENLVVKAKLEELLKVNCSEPFTVMGLPESAVSQINCPPS
jgi:hypothetical protein